MSAVCILAPVVMGGWPAFSAAVVAAAASLGYVVSEDQVKRFGLFGKVKNEGRSVTLEIENSELVTDQLGRDQKIVVTRDGVTVTFNRDARGKVELSVKGEGHEDGALRAFGEELSQRVVQQYVYQRITEEMRAKGFNVVDEGRSDNQAIHLKVRHWEN